MHKFDVATLAQANALGDIEFAQPKETLPIVTVGKSADVTLAPAAVASTKTGRESVSSIPVCYSVRRKLTSSVSLRLPSHI